MKGIFFLVILFLSLSGCTTAKIYNSAADMQVFLGVPPTGQKYKILKRIKDTEKICLDYTRSYDVGPLIRKAVDEYSADAMISVTWKTKTTFTSGVLNFVTLGIAQCRDVELEGTLVKFEK